MRPPISLIVGLTIAASPAHAEAQSSRGPRLPDAVEKMPAWLADAPFDAAKFFGMPPPEQNAAPLYLDALFEFDDEMASCFPVESHGRAPIAKARAARMKAVWEAWDKDPKLVDPARIDALLAEFAELFRKIDLAQRRDRCVFAIGLTYESSLPHAQVAWRVPRLWTMQVDRDLASGDFDHAIACVEKTLRLSRDLRPRGPIICQTVSTAIDWAACDRMIDLLLADPRLKPADCDRLLGIVRRHEAEALDPFATGVQGEYFLERAFHRVFAEGMKPGIDGDGRPLEVKLDRLGVARQLASSLGVINGTAAELKAFKSMSAESLAARADLADYFAVASPRLKREREAIDEIARSLLAVTAATDPDRKRAVASLVKTYLGDDPPGPLVILRLFCPDYGFHSTVCARDDLYVRAAQCRLAVRRWQLTHRQPPTDLDAVCKAAGLPSVPVDPFSGGPMKMTTDAGAIVVYSVGLDGRDDRGLKDSDLGRRPDGDMIFPMPKLKQGGP